jgi:hypothetical protein
MQRNPQIAGRKAVHDRVRQRGSVPKNSCTETSCPVSSSTSRSAASRGVFAVIELAFGKDPFVALAQPHHRDQRSFFLPQHNTSRRQNRRSRGPTSHVYDFESRFAATPSTPTI